MTIIKGTSDQNAGTKIKNKESTLKKLNTIEMRALVVE